MCVCACVCYKGSWCYTGVEDDLSCVWACECVAVFPEVTSVVGWFNAGD